MANGLWAILCVGALLGCGGGATKRADSVPSGDDDVAIEPDDAAPDSSAGILPNAVWDARVCERAHACRDSYDECEGCLEFETIYHADCDIIVTSSETVAASVAAGTVSYVQSDVDECLAAARFDDVPCDQFFAPGARPEAPMACWSAIVGHVEVGGACQSNYDCAVKQYQFGVDRSCQDDVCQPESP